jgi:hypothetical protein
VLDRSRDRLVARAALEREHARDVLRSDARGLAALTPGVVFIGPSDSHGMTPCRRG